MKELTEFQKKLLREFAADKRVYFRYDVADCEHYGDMMAASHRVENVIKPHGGILSDSYWDGHDCGEAWIECSVPYDALEEIFKTGFFEYDPWQ